MSPLKARDLMTAGVVAVAENTPVESVARLMKQYRIRSIPVVDASNRVVGVVRDEDLFVKEQTLPFSFEKVPTLLDQRVDVDRLPEVYHEVRRRSVADVMARELACVDIEDGIGAIVRTMMKRGATQVFVLDGEELAGVVSRLDLVGLLAEADGRR
jgi:CBS domain-containing membrane protein